MYDCAKSSLYGSEGKCEMEELTDEIEKSIKKDTVENYREKLGNSVEIENYNSIKLKKIAPLIIKLKEEYPYLDELKRRGNRLKKESQLVPENEELENMAVREVEKYNKRMEYFINLADEIIGADEFSRSFKSEKTESYMDHKILFRTLKMYRKIFKEQIDIQKEMRKKMITVLMVGIEDEFALDAGTEFIDFLKEDIKKYNKEIQKELKKYSLDKLKEVLLNLKLLTNVYGYNSREITFDFILKEMELIKSILKKDKSVYESNSKYLREFSESMLSEIKTILIEEVKGNLEKQIRKLRDEKKEIESILRKCKKSKEISDIKIEQQRIKKEIQKLYTLKSSKGKASAEDDRDLNEKIEKNVAKIVRLNERLDELNAPPKDTLCNLGGILGIIGLEIKNEDKDKNDLSNKDTKSMTEIDSFSEEEFFIKEERNLQCTDLESVLQHYDVNVFGKKNDEELSYEEFHVKLKYYQEKIKGEEELFVIKSKIENDEKINSSILDEKDKVVESITSEDFNYKTEELLSNQSFSEDGNCKELEEEILSEREFDYKTEEILSDQELNSEEEEKLLSKKAEEGFEEYIPMNEEEKRNIYIKLSDISSRLRNLERRFEKVDKALKDTKKRTKQYDKLIERQEDRKDKIRNEIEKYEVLKNLAEAINKGKDASYQLLYT